MAEEVTNPTKNHKISFNPVFDGTGSILWFSVSVETTYNETGDTQSESRYRINVKDIAHFLVGREVPTTVEGFYKTSPSAEQTRI